MTEHELTQWLEATPKTGGHSQILPENQKVGHTLATAITSGALQM
jgi:hypothetical protein